MAQNNSSELLRSILALLGFQHIINLFHSEYASVLCGYDHTSWGFFIKCVNDKI